MKIQFLWMANPSLVYPGRIYRLVISPIPLIDSQSLKDTIAEYILGHSVPR